MLEFAKEMELEISSVHQKSHNALTIILMYGRGHENALCAKLDLHFFIAGARVCKRNGAGDF